MKTALPAVHSGRALAAPFRKGALRLVLAACAAVAAGSVHVAQAHPHMWIDASAVLAFDRQGRLESVRQRWRFDEMFVSYTTQGLKKNKDGGLAPATLDRMAADWMNALGEPISHYFTRVSAGGKALAFGAPRDAKVQWDAKRKEMALVFTLPLAQAVMPGKDGVQVDVFDPTYFVAYSFDEAGAVSLANAPAACAVSYRPPRDLDWKTMQQLAAIPAEQTDLPQELMAITKGLTHRIQVTCP